MKNSYLVMSLALASLNHGCGVFYVAKQGVYQMKLLAGAEPIYRALRQPELAVRARNKLILITQVREYCQNQLKLRANKNYKDVNLSWHNIIYNVSASETLQFKAYTWWFPVIGSVPYKGYFEQSDADAEVTRLKGLGLDTLKRRVGGYSTLGYFSDPVWPSMLEMSDEALVELIIHELAHATVYIPNQTPFNETFANFVGKTGARLYYKVKYGDDSDEIRHLDKYYSDEIMYNKFFSQLYVNLDTIYTMEIPDAQKRSAQKIALEQAQESYKKLPIGDEFKNIDWSQVNNAYLLGFKTYNHDETVFVELFRLVKGDFARFLDQVARYSRGPDPFVALQEHVDTSAGTL